MKLSAVLEQVRSDLNDLPANPFTTADARWSDRELVIYINLALGQIYRARPDLFLRTDGFSSYDLKKVSLGAVWKASETVSVGDVRVVTVDNIPYVLVCISGGITDADQPDAVNPNQFGNVDDNGVLWKEDDVDLPDSLQEALVHYVCYKCYDSPDADKESMKKSMLNYELFSKEMTGR